MKKQKTQPNDYFQSQSQKNRVGRKVLHSTRTVFLMHALVLVSSFAVGLGLVSQMGESRAATNWRISPSGSDSNPCTASQPCLTMNRAYQVASPGDTVEMAGGSYAKQTISYLASKSTPGDSLANVLFRPVSGDTVAIGGVEIRSSNIEVRDVKSSFNVTTYSLSNKDPATSSQYPRILQHPIPSDIVIRNIDANGTSFDVHTANNVYIQNVDVGNFTGTSDGFRISGVAKPYEPTNVVLDNIRLHDVRRTAGSTNHVDCMQISGAKGLVIKNSKFWHCATQGVFLKEASGQTIDNVLIENNWFGPCTIPGQDVSCTQNLILDDGISNTTVRFNSFGSTAGLRTASGVGTSNLYVYGNIGSRPTCTGSATPIYAYNVWQPGGSVCPNSNDLVATSVAQLGFTSDPSSGSNFDYHINSSSIARNRIPASFATPDGRPKPTNDIENQARPAETNYDVGADEFGSGSAPAPGPSPSPTPPPPSASPPPSPASNQTVSDIPPIPVSGANPIDPVTIPADLKVESDGTIVADFTGDGVNEIVKDVNQDGKIDPKTEIIQQLEPYNDESNPLAQTSTTNSFQPLSPSTGFLGTTSGKLTFAGIFAGLVTTTVGGAYVAHHYYNWRIPFLSFFRRDKDGGDGPIGMISG